MHLQLYYHNDLELSAVMYVCLCNAVTDKEIAQAVSEGASNLSSVQNTTGAATGCGSCKRTAEIIIDQCLAEKLTNAA